MGFIKNRPMIVLGAGLTVLFLAFGIVRVNFLDSLEMKFYDVRMHLRSRPDPTSRIVMVDIDDESIEKLGRWPWPRSLVARGIRKIKAGGPRVIGLNMILSEPEPNRGLEAVRNLRETFAADLLPLTGDKGRAFLDTISETMARLDDDRDLEDANRDAGDVVLPVFFRTTGAGGAETAAGDEDLRLAGNVLVNVTNPQGLWVDRADAVTLPIKRFLDVAAGIGCIHLDRDVDGTTRREPMVYAYRGVFVPAYSLRLAANFLNIPLARIRVQIGKAIHLGNRTLPLTFHSQYLIGFKGARNAFRHYAFSDVVNGKIPPRTFHDKLVLVSAPASGIANPLRTPTDAAMPPGEFNADTLWSIINGQAISAPAWSRDAELMMILFIGLIITFVLPRLKALHAGILFWVLLAGLIGGASALFVQNALWIGVTYAVLELVLGYIGVVSIRCFAGDTGKEKIEGKSAETNRMLGLGFQNQGMLDMAFDTFRRVPVDHRMKDLLYNLALDFERKQQLDKAGAVLEYIASHDPKFKDVAERKKRLMQASDTMVFGEGLPGESQDDRLLATPNGARPTLGRYEIVRQLGKGAMGIVYLGLDPRINRTTAIKTFRFANDMDPDEVRELKQKFFREAESAGTLSHPNIVTIYDAGDEQDLAYIAMEFLEGTDLDAFTKEGRLLPIRKVIDAVADVADALDYAHRRGIVHRDIKPANIMLLRSGAIKITDFGIARITATSQTQTGVVKGTPYYMSPEQFSGEKVDGRSDIFSLGAMLYQLLTGHLPFAGASPPALMHQIMNAKHPDPRTYNPKIVKPLVTILDKSLEKEREKRYPKAGLMAAHLRQLGRGIDEAMARRKASRTT